MPAVLAFRKNAYSADTRLTITVSTDPQGTDLVPVTFEPITDWGDLMNDPTLRQQVVDSLGQTGDPKLVLAGVGLNNVPYGQTLYVRAVAEDSTEVSARSVARGFGTVFSSVGRYYYGKDHLGSVRVTVTGSGEVVQASDYDPFGLELDGRSLSKPAAPVERYAGYELDEETDLYYAGARYYDPLIGRFGATDRFAEKYPALTPYQYAANNPLYYIDVNGDSLDVNGLDEDTRQKLLKELSEFTGLALAIDDSGFLIAVEELRGAYGTHSETARDFLLSAIKSLTKVSVNLQTGFQYIDQGSRGLPREIIYNTSQIEFNIASTPGAEIDQRTLGYGLSFLHELTHTDLGRDFYNTGSTIYDSPRGGVAPARQYINGIRRELGPFFGERTGTVVPTGSRLRDRARVFNVNGNDVLIPLKKRKRRQI